jgi:hypothetical protein
MSLLVNTEQNKAAKGDMETNGFDQYYNCGSTFYLEKLEKRKSAAQHLLH